MAEGSVVKELKAEIGQSALNRLSSRRRTNENPPIVNSSVAMSISRGGTTDEGLLKALRNRNSNLSPWFREDFSNEELSAMSSERVPGGARHIGNDYVNTSRGPQIRSRIWIDKNGKYYREVY